MCRARIVAVILLAVALAGCRRAPPNPRSAFYDVRTFGAAADGTTKDTAAFQRAIDTASHNGGVVEVPAGKYLIGSIHLKTNTTLELAPGATLQGSPDPNDYPLNTVRYEGEDVPGRHALIWADHARNVAILGPDELAGVGPGLIAGDASIGSLRHPRGPVMLELSNCDHVTLNNFSETYRRLWSIHLLYCNDVTASRLHLRTSGNNGDGIDVDSSSNITIESCDIDTGDDCISLKSGRGLAAVRAHHPTTNITIRDCRFGSNFAGIGIGSEMSGGVDHVRISNCTFTHGVNAIFLKSRTGRGGYLRDIHADHLTAESAVRNFLGIGLNNHGIIGTEPVPGLAGIPQVSDIVITNVTLHDVGRLVDGAHVDPAKPVNGLTLSDITGTCRRGIALMNVDNARLLRINVTGFTGPLLATQNVTGIGVQDAVPLPPQSPTTMRSTNTP